MAGNDSHIQQGEVDSLVEAIEELRDRIAELEAALRPFSDAADVAEEIRAVKIGTDEIRYPVRMGDLRAARALLPADGEKDAPEEEGGDDAYIVPPDMATEAEYWKARCVLELVFGLHPLIDVNSDGFRESIRDIRTRLRDGDFDPDLYTIAYEELGVD